MATRAGEAISGRRVHQAGSAGERRVGNYLKHGGNEGDGVAGRCRRERVHFGCKRLRASASASGGRWLTGGKGREGGRKKKRLLCNRVRLLGDWEMEIWTALVIKGEIDCTPIRVQWLAPGSRSGLALGALDRLAGGHVGKWLGESGVGGHEQGNARCPIGTRLSFRRHVDVHATETL